MLNLTTIQGIYHYINTFKEGQIKFDMLQGLKVELNKTKYRNKNNLYVIFEEGNQMQIITHDRYTHKFDELIEGFSKCVYIDNAGIHVKYHDNINMYRILLYNDVLKYLFNDLDQREQKYNYGINLSKLIDNIDKNINKWYTLEDAQTVYTEYLNNNIKLIPVFSSCKKYVYFINDYHILNREEVREINFNMDIYNINYYPTIYLINNDGKKSFILNDIISNDLNYIKSKFNDFKLKCIEDGIKFNLDNSKLSYIINN